MKACIIGAGVTGLSLLLLLTHEGIDPSDISIIDPHFECGDLGRRWSQVLSNTPWSKTVDTLNRLLGLRLPSSPKTTLLKDIADLFISLTAPIAVNRIKGFATSVERKGGAWTVSYNTSSPNTLQSKAIFMCQGSNQKIINQPIPSIPLECAFDSRLSHFIRPGDKVTVFGTMHSGTLVIKNLHDLSASITAVYRGSTPFVWDRDGAYDGIKEEAAAIADKIIAGEIPVTLTNKPPTDSRWVIYATGFTPRIISGLGQEYDGMTGAIRGAPNAWGFGIAYPNAAPDGVHWDVSVAAFLNHIKAQIPAIRELIF